MDISHVKNDNSDLIIWVCECLLPLVLESPFYALMLSLEGQSSSTCNKDGLFKAASVTVQL